MMYVLYPMLRNAGGVIWTTYKDVRLDQPFELDDGHEPQSFPGNRQLLRVRHPLREA